MTDPAFTEVLFWDLGGGAIAGLAVGYAIKRASRWALLVLGLSIVALYGLSQTGMVSVHWDIVGQGIESGARSVSDWIWVACKELSIAMIGFGGGMAAGLKMSA
ncbi:MAG: FUN14 domain-containing protein [Vulcanimicrobiota bacterium]|nr:FUN14 domain-containing protein [Candidatus Eremiobacteraeota bacterium]